MPCLDCGSDVISGRVQKVYQPYPPSHTVAVPVCIRLQSGDEVNGVKYTSFSENNDCNDPSCVDACHTWYEYNGAVVTGVQEIDCAIVEADPPLTPGVEAVCNDAAGTWTSPACTTEIRITVSQSDATGPTITVGANPPQIISTNGSPYVWRAQAGNVIDSLTLTNNSLNQCSDITWLQRGTVAIPEAWIVDDTQAGQETTLGKQQAISYNGKLYITTAAGVVRYDGSTWTNVLSGAVVRSIVEDSGNLYVTRGNQIYESTDDGLTFSLFDTAPVSNLAGIAWYGGELYVCSMSAGNIYRRTAPATWSTIPYAVGTSAVYQMIVFNGRLWVTANVSGAAPNLLYYYDGAVWNSVNLVTGRAQGVLSTHAGDLWFHSDVSDGPSTNRAYVIDTLDAVTEIVAPARMIAFFSDGATMYAVDLSNGVYTVTTGGGFVAFQSIAPSYTIGNQVVSDGATVWASGVLGANTSTQYYQPPIAGNCA